MKHTWALTPNSPEPALQRVHTTGLCHYSGNFSVILEFLHWFFFSSLLGSLSSSISQRPTSLARELATRSNPTLLFPSREALGISLNLTGPQFLHLESGYNRTCPSDLTQLPKALCKHKSRGSIKGTVPNRTWEKSSPRAWACKDAQGFPKH